MHPSTLTAYHSVETNHSTMEITACWTLMDFTMFPNNVVKSLDFCITWNGLSLFFLIKAAVYTCIQRNCESTELEEQSWHLAQVFPPSVVTSIYLLVFTELLPVSMHTLQFNLAMWYNRMNALTMTFQPAVLTDSCFAWKTILVFASSRLHFNKGTLIWDLVICNSKHIPSSSQDSWAIAKTTARCAQYMGALKSLESPHQAPGYFSRNL